MARYYEADQILDGMMGGECSKFQLAILPVHRIFRNLMIRHWWQSNLFLLIPYQKKT